MAGSSTYGALKVLSWTFSRTVSHSHASETPRHLRQASLPRLERGMDCASLGSVSSRAEEARTVARPFLLLLALLQPLASCLAGAALPSVHLPHEGGDGRTFILILSTSIGAVDLGSPRLSVGTLSSSVSRHWIIFCGLPCEVASKFKLSSFQARVQTLPLSLVYRSPERNCRAIITADLTLFSAGSVIFVPHLGWLNMESVAYSIVGEHHAARERGRSWPYTPFFECGRCPAGHGRMGA